MAAARANSCKASVEPRSRMIILRTMASSAIRITVRACTMLSCRRDDKKRTLELECDDNSKDGAEHGLEHRIVGRVEGLGYDDGMENPEREVPNGEDDDDC